MNRIIYVKNISSLLLPILLGAVLSVLCMGVVAVHTVQHTTHEHATARISCTQNEIANHGCIPGHNSLITALTQVFTATTVLLVLILLSFSSFSAFLKVKPGTVRKQFYKTRWRLGQQIRAAHVLHWLVILQKQDSYAVAVA
ncbi:MAG: hypothetical protein JNK33_01740 [Candidatus Doudnabacteria bacterium]|nr:hypothetical protein [Candidatus Doudnabacteria bacterium]